MEEHQQDILRVAAGARDAEILQDYAKKYGLEVFNFADRTGNTPLHLACDKGRREVVQGLVENGSKINTRNNAKKTPLHILVERRHADLAKWLVWQGADIGLKDAEGKTPVQVAHSWLAGELKEIAAKLEQAQAQSGQHVLVSKVDKYGDNPSSLNLKGGTDNSAHSAAAKLARSKISVVEETVSISVKNGKSRSVTYSSSHAVQDVARLAATAFGMEQLDVALFVRNKASDPFRPLDKEETLSRIRANEWDSPDSYPIYVLPAVGASSETTTKYREVMYQLN